MRMRLVPELAGQPIHNTRLLFGGKSGRGMLLFLGLLSILLLAGCADMTQTQQRTLSGGAMGAAGGAVVGALAGNAGLGAAIGGAAGAGGGYLYGRHKEAEESAYRQGVREGEARAAGY